MTSRPGPRPIDAIVIGSGPNGLAAAIALAQAGQSVRVYEAQPTLGGGLRSLPLTGPDCINDVCATVHALVAASPFLTSLPLARFGVEFVHPPVPFAHPLDDGTAVVVDRSVRATADSLMARDGRSYARLMTPFVERSRDLFEALLAPPRPRHPLLMARFGLRAGLPATLLSKVLFRDERTRAMFAGAAAHSVLPLEFLTTAGFGLALVVAAHAVGWPVARGGSQRVADGLAAYLKSLGGEIVTGERIDSLDALPPSRAVLCDVSPRQLVQLAGDRMPARHRDKLMRYRYGPGVFKMDWTLSGPVPWTAEGCRRAGTIHLGSTLGEIADSERAAWEGRVHDRPYVLLVQPSVADPTRAPAGKHVLWAYAHVPHGTTVDFTDPIERQIERYAPGFRDCVLARHSMGPADMERRNANLIGGDITGGASDLRQLWARPVLGLNPYTTPVEGVYLCSASTPPGVGVHGMCGYYAAQTGSRPPASGSRLESRLAGSRKPEAGSRDRVRRLSDKRPQPLRRSNILEPLNCRTVLRSSRYPLNDFAPVHAGHAAALRGQRLCRVDLRDRLVSAPAARHRVVGHLPGGAARDLHGRHVSRLAAAAAVHRR